MNVKSVLLRPNFERKNTFSVLSKTVALLKDIGLVPMLSEESAKIAGNDFGCFVREYHQLLKTCDIVLSVGGDGTMLRAAHDAIVWNKPIIGVNSGTVGFLTQLEPNEIGFLSKLARGEYKVSGRMLLEARITENGQTSSHIAVNDIVIRREDTNQILSVDVHNDNRPIFSQRADGIIFATPTGSTAYSLSAGGPVVSPEMSVIVLSPICPHGTFRASLVLPPEKRYEVTETSGKDCGFIISVDGRLLGHHNTVTISKSEKQVKFIDIGNRDFYENLNQKLSF